MTTWSMENLVQTRYIYTEALPPRVFDIWIQLIDLYNDSTN